MKIKGEVLEWLKRHARIDVVYIFSKTGTKNNYGEVLEWLKRHAWKVCISVKGYQGFESLPLRKKPYRNVRLCCFYEEAIKNLPNIRRYATFRYITVGHFPGNFNRKVQV